MKKIPLFEGISTIELEKIFAGLNVNQVFFRKGEILARTDEPCNRLITILTGVIKGEISDSSGKTIKIEEIAAPYSVASLFVFSQGNCFPMQITAIEDTKALVIPSHTLFKMLLRNEKLLRNYLHLSATLAYYMLERIHFMSFLTIRQKLALHILELSATHNTNSFKLDTTHISIAEYFGVSRQALEKDIKKMIDEGLIAINKKEITILNKKKLEYLAKF